MSGIIFLFDENLPHSIAESLNVIEKSRGDDLVFSTAVLIELGRGKTDLEIVQYAKSIETDCYIVTNDKDFKKRELYKLIMQSSNVGLFLIKFPKGSKYWRKYKFMVNHWEKIKQIVISESNPIAYQVSYRNKFKKI